MARKPKNNADYFPHDNDMRNNDKIKAVRRMFGHTGYSVWCMMLEKLCKSNDFTLEYNDLNIELWSGDFIVASDELQSMINYFIKLDLLTSFDGMLFSEKMIENFSGLMQKRDREAKYRKTLTTPVMQQNGINNVVNAVECTKATLQVRQNGINNVVREQSKVKESKVNKSKVEREAPTLAEIISFFESEGFSKEHAEKAYKYYQDANWHDSRGKPVLNLKQKLRANWMKDSDRTQVQLSKTQTILSEYEQLDKILELKYGNEKPTGML